jgi:AcrR family transcriptional regulator
VPGTVQVTSVRLRHYHGRDMWESREALPRSAIDNRARLLDLAGDLFAEQGYVQVSVRDLASRLGLTTGAIYSNFRSKGDLLAEILERRVRQDMEQSHPDMPLPEYVHDSFRQLSTRTTMRALLVEAAAAARTDPELRGRLNPVLSALLSHWIGDYRDWQKVLHVDRRIDMDGLVRTLWSIELGLGILEATGGHTVKREELATFVSSYLKGLERTDGPRKSGASAPPTKGAGSDAPDALADANREFSAPTGALRDSPRAAATQLQLMDAAVELFAARGYRAVTVRDLARATSLTTGSIYGNFANKAVLLVEVIEARIGQDLERLPADLLATASPADLVEFNLLAFASRARLRSLVLEGAAAARSDGEVRTRLRSVLEYHLATWASGLEDRLGGSVRAHPGVLTAVTAVWGAELGLGLFEALELPTPTPAQLAATFKAMFSQAGFDTRSATSKRTVRNRVAR